MMSEVTMSDYDEVDGIYFPFSMTRGIKEIQSTYNDHKNRVESSSR